jgi:hypothetical protein
MAVAPRVGGGETGLIRFGTPWHKQVSCERYSRRPYDQRQNQCFEGTHGRLPHHAEIAVCRDSLNCQAKDVLQRNPQEHATGSQSTIFRWERLTQPGRECGIESFFGGVNTHGLA